jgi:(p)ppGpp synthase/HD superfamily hydrolase
MSEHSAPDESAARELARRAHQGQRDKAGRDYFEDHLLPIATASAAFGGEVVAAAWLHDVLEDTNATVDDLTRAGIPQSVTAAVESVTRGQDETYSELILRACADPVGRYVKLVDNAWNITSNAVLAQVDPDRAASC